MMSNPLEIPEILAHIILSADCEFQSVSKKWIRVKEILCPLIRKALETYMEKYIYNSFNQIHISDEDRYIDIYSIVPAKFEFEWGGIIYWLDVRRWSHCVCVRDYEFPCLSNKHDCSCLYYEIEANGDVLAKNDTKCLGEKHHCSCEFGPYDCLASGHECVCP